MAHGDRELRGCGGSPRGLEYGRNEVKAPHIKGMGFFAFAVLAVVAYFVYQKAKTQGGIKPAFLGTPTPLAGGGYSQVG